ncbi:hypothetical protein BDV96DRAFT_578063 [Lophiotrema nucula]|uniref:Uncharacterized protein n=1 Tax=Lophiotrema nucula TaxID=690887 RepID=A0A6A5Z3J2_9PLEO|nr:hypothetical protein BDV96DRAFT_578063 [Lophiotrema nucula]
MARQPDEEGATSHSANAGSDNLNLLQRTTSFAHGLPTPESASTLPSPWPSFRPRTSAPESMNDASSTKGNNKRAADDADDTEDDRDNDDHNAIIKPPSPPHVVRRAHNRRPSALWDLNPPATALFPQTPSHQGRPFNIFKALLRHPNLFFQFALRLPPSTFLSLYSIDKEFHYRANKYSISLIYDFAKHHAPEAVWVFSWMLYPDLCISDPLLKPMDGRSHLARDIPGLRWVNMILSREKVVQEILTLLALEGHRVPAQTKGVLMKFWVVMERTSQGVREAFLADRGIWKDEDILLFQLLLVKLDMRIGCPVDGHGCGALSHLLLTQKSLIRLRNVLAGRDLDEALDDIITKTYLEDDFDNDNFPLLIDHVQDGVPPHMFGELSHENWEGTSNETMESAVDLVIMEGMKRRLNIQFWLPDFVTAGWLDHEGKNLPRPRKYFKVQTVRAGGIPPTAGELNDMEAALDCEWGCGKKRVTLPIAILSVAGGTGI